MDTPDTVLWLKKKPFGPQASTIFYSLIEGGKANGLEPYDYLCREL
ncbi:transposase domain-containing protein [Endozoicomonas acroporae]|nr:transposase domain-containing protein [Endozoicomonas acroporae]